MRGIRYVLAALAATSLLATVTPSAALPSGPPSLRFGWYQDGDTVSMGATATDPDGAIFAMSMCVEGGPCTAWAEPEPGLDPASCLLGDEATIRTEHIFPGPGLYEVTVSASGGGCPVLGMSETVEETLILEVAPLPVEPPPHDPVICAQDGTPTATAPGVTEDHVRIATVVPVSGPRASELSGVPFGLRAAVLAINDAGGVCGRELVLDVLDDGSDEQRRRRLVRTLANRGETFALVGMDVTGAVEDIDADGLPTVGSFTESRTEFSAGWLWPIRAGSEAYGGVATEHAYAEGARRFALVYDDASPLGVESKESVEATLAAHGDATLVASIPVRAARASYAAEVQAFNEACGIACDAVIYALDPQTMLTWYAGGPRRASIIEEAHPRVFNHGFASNCGSRCRDLVVFTDQHPPIGDQPPEVTRYCRDLGTADCSNPYTQAAYTSVLVAARAMGAAGTDLTRAAFRGALETGLFDEGMTGGPLSWDHPRRHANRWLRAYSIVVAQGSFAGFRAQTEWLEDPRG